VSLPAPYTAIFEESAVPDEWIDYVELNREWFEDREGVRDRVIELQAV